ncbi:MAG: GlmU family protein [Flavobacteriales bacterium]|nr:GlmU family protein [Flavobacteriales bacterium]
MNIILFDNKNRNDLLPLVYTRPVCELRVGILTIREKWEKYLGDSPSYKTEEYLQTKFPLVSADDTVWIDASVLPNIEIVQAVKTLAQNQSIVDENNQLLACRGDIHDSENCERISIHTDRIRFPEDIFSKNGVELEKDFDLLTTGRKSKEISGSNRIIGNGRIFLEETASVEGAILNATSGSIYVGHHAEIMEGSIVRGGLALCEHAALKLGSKIYGPTTVGPHSKVGGEVINSVILGYSNKGHDGFLGNSVLGEWCNIGADSNNSNLKNNYAEVKLWDYTTERFRNTKLQFCGLIMADHSKCGINTMFNTGTVVGVSANIFGSGFPRNFVPSFAWGGSAGFSTYQLNKAFETADLVMKRRGIELDETEKNILKHVFEMSEKFRFWEK